MQLEQGESSKVLPMISQARTRTVTLCGSPLLGIAVYVSLA
jgi:hypothetical protein